MFPKKRMRRLRKKESLRNLLSETKLDLSDLIYPIFVEKRSKPLEIDMMEGIKRYPIEDAVQEAKEAEELGIPAIILFGVPEEKDKKGTYAWKKNGVIQQTAREISKNTSLTVITDVCLCEYTSHGHCGVLKNKQVQNDETLKLLKKTAISHAEAGADIVAPSGMMDGMVKTIREGLDKEGYENTSIMSYSAKYASNFYGPFREAAESAPEFGDRKRYQMNPKQKREAIIENRLDIKEGADILMVKPAMPYLDIINETSQKFEEPLAAYQVSGEYSMLKQAINNNLVSEKIILESLISIKRAGADFIITYFAKKLAQKSTTPP
ncbi:MAG: Delta-aminolevulinic acid dehydratase Hemb [Candidatus Methanohalarchaeum thermophilum]|uniref:Delta-aminolevulinic acid dehydratase n=1 Tax=Methanohalarchaeum thermophilum TaxID=1903181 RepID=A0A1Q6DUL3_METT1|nr:MAG: Delta-aminolevulinic acid dehydratase Hemb [Candidatus Methanohalarchaeum thermophilum]